LFFEILSQKIGWRKKLSTLSTKHSGKKSGKIWIFSPDFLEKKLQNLHNATLQLSACNFATFGL